MVPRVGGLGLGVFFFLGGGVSGWGVLRPSRLYAALGLFPSVEVDRKDHTAQGFAWTHRVLVGLGTARLAVHLALQVV